MYTLKHNTLVNYAPTSRVGVKGWAAIRRYLAVNHVITYGKAVRLSSSQVVNRLTSNKVLVLSSVKLQ